MSTKKPQSIIDIENDITKIKLLFQSPDGKAVFDLLNEEFADRSSFVAGDSHGTAFREGQRSVILFVMDALESEYEA